MSRFLPGVAVLAAAIAAAVGGCSASDSGPTALPSGPGLTTTAAPSTAATTSATAAAPSSSTGTRRSPIRWLGRAATGTEAAVQQATRSYWSMVVRLAEKPDPDDPEIAALSVDPQAGQLVTLFTNVRAQGLSQRGPIDGSVTVGAVRGSSATATTCLDQRLTRLYGRAGTPRPGSAGTRSQFAVSLTLAGGTWKVSRVTASGADCTLPR